MQNVTYDLSEARRASLARCWEILLILAMKATVEELKTSNPPEVDAAPGGEGKNGDAGN